LQIMNLADHAWAIVIIGGPILLAAAVLWAKLANRRRPARNPVSERGSRDLYRRLDAEARADEARAHDAPTPTPTPIPKPTPPSAAPGEQEHPNLSTQYQREGDAKRPSDQLDRGQQPAPDGGRKSSLTHDS
jgi:hypothetical protein